MRVAETITPHISRTKNLQNNNNHTSPSPYIHMWVQVDVTATRQQHKPTRRVTIHKIVHIPKKRHRRGEAKSGRDQERRDRSDISTAHQRKFPDRQRHKEKAYMRYESASVPRTQRFSATTRSKEQSRERRDTARRDHAHDATRGDAERGRGGVLGGRRGRAAAAGRR